MNNERRYERSLVDKIEAGVKVIEEGGLPIECRPVPDDDRDHALDPRVVELFRRRKSGEFPTPQGNDIMSMRSRSNKETHQIDSGEVSERVVQMNFPDRVLQLFLFEPRDYQGRKPILVYLHGGGFTVGNIGQFRNALRLLADVSGCIVAYPEYRLAPETPFPGAVLDCNDTVEWIASHADELGIDSSKVALAGDSAGGSLANAATIMQRDTGRIKLIIEMYPLVDAGPVPPEWSHDMYPCLPEQREVAMSRTDRIKNASQELPGLYCQGRTALGYDPLISATYYARLCEFPRTVVVASEFDYLRYQDEAFARKLSEEGVSVRCIRYLGCDHGFFETCGVMPQVEDLVNVMAGELNAL
uniref:alpha/beta hydrolase n=1 Tax=Olsenella uli TaxID=133926 RepID=UPI0028E68E6B|nr:alpha/beta hydrolase [Olsenella uli]